MTTAPELPIERSESVSLADATTPKFQLETGKIGPRRITQVLRRPPRRLTPSLNRGATQLWAPTAGDSRQHEWAGNSGAVAPWLPVHQATEWPIPGTINGVDPISKRIITFDPLSALQGGYASNPNMLVVATPGSGKSALIKLHVLDGVARGRKVAILGDSKGEYSQVVAALDGTVHEIAPGRGMTGIRSKPATGSFV